MTHTPSTDVAVIDPVFSDAERYALAAFLAGYRGLLRRYLGAWFPILTVGGYNRRVLFLGSRTRDSPSASSCPGDVVDRLHRLPNDAGPVPASTRPPAERP
jgi:hypothetical protein